MDRKMRRDMIERGNKLPITRQCRLLKLNRSGIYHRPQGESIQNLALMRVIDQQFLETPFFGAGQMTWHLQRLGHRVNIKRVRRLMRCPWKRCFRRRALA